jgi:intein-encoded DNA endonuclease-like protein
MTDEASRLNVPKHIGQGKPGRRSSGRMGPLDLRLLIYEEALKLRQAGCSYKKVISSIENQYGVRLAKSTLSTWVNGTHTPFGGVNLFLPIATPELAYAIGVLTGDASLNLKQNHYEYRIRLQAIDREFVEAFDEAVSKVLRCPTHRLWKGQAREIHVEIGSYLLHKFLQKPLRELMPFIEHDSECSSAFLRGFFDSEGSVSLNGALTAFNTDLELLRYVQMLLARRFGIESTGPHLGSRKGSILHKRGRSYFRNSDCYRIYIRTNSLRTFSREIGLTIDRKRVRLERKVHSSD